MNNNKLHIFNLWVLYVYMDGVFVSFIILFVKWSEVCKMIYISDTLKKYKMIYYSTLCSQNTPQ